MSKVKEPLFRVVKREGMKKRYIALLYLGAVVLALGIGAILLFSLDLYGNINYNVIR